MDEGWGGGGWDLGVGVGAGRLVGFIGVVVWVSVMVEGGGVKAEAPGIDR